MLGGFGDFIKTLNTFAYLLETFVLDYLPSLCGLEPLVWNMWVTNDDNKCCVTIPVAHLNSYISSYSSVPKNYQHVLALAFAVKEINEDPNILPNISLGFHILDSYYSAKMTYKATLNLLSTQHRFVPNYKCHIESNLIALIGGCIAEVSANVAILTANPKVPQVSSTLGVFAKVFIINESTLS